MTKQTSPKTKPQGKGLYYKQLNSRFWRSQFKQWEIKTESVDGVAELANECKQIKGAMLDGIYLIKLLTKGQKLTTPQREQAANFLQAARYLSHKFHQLQDRAEAAKITTADDKSEQ